MKTDLEIQKDVQDELKWEPFLNAAEIGVAVKNGIVTLSGGVDSYYKKTRAEKAAKRVAGVIAVAEDIEVNLNGSTALNDTEIAKAVVHALQWHSAIRENKVKVKVEDGVVTLDGELEYEHQKKLAVKQIQNLVGVKKIVNNINVKPCALPQDLKQKINSAFHRSATLDAAKIGVTISGDKVILTGYVRSLAEKNDAENAVWSAPGVRYIENKLLIERPVFAL